MAATTGYQAGLEANQTVLSYAVESVWGTKPTVQFQAIRYTSETLAMNKTRQRPAEINAAREVSAGVTTQQSAAGTVNFALSWQSHEDFISSLLGSDWQAAQVIAGIAGDLALTNTSATAATLISTTAGKFTNIAAGQFVRLLGFTNAANNGVYRVATKVSALSLILTSLVPTVTETPAGTAAQVRASTIQNGTQFKSLWIQQKLSSSLFLTYPGSYVTGMTLSGAVGQFFNGGFTIAAQQELSATSEGSTGAVLAASTGKVFDTVAGVAGVYLNEVSIGTGVDSFSLNLQNQSAAAEFGVGSSTALGMLAGTFVATGQIKLFFNSFTLYTKFTAETSGTLEFIIQDSSKNIYVVTLLNATFSSGSIDAGSQGTAIMATFGIECGPVSGGTGTVMIDRLPST